MGQGACARGYKRFKGGSMQEEISGARGVRKEWYRECDKERRKKDKERLVGGKRKVLSRDKEKFGRGQVKGKKRVRKGW